MARLVDFFFENGEILEGLLDVLGNEKKAVIRNKRTVRIYKFMIAVEILRENRECVVWRSNGVKYDKEIPIENFCSTYNSLKMCILRKGNLYEDRLFIEKVDTRYRHTHFFKDYVQREINDEQFVQDLQYFIEKKKRLAS